jgi:hypothetical protein
MTWHTPRGDRVLAGPEAELFRDALMIITDWIEGDADPAKAHDARSRMGIDESYFRAVAPDPSDEELAAIRLRLRLLRD